MKIKTNYVKIIQYYANLVDKDKINAFLNDPSIEILIDYENMDKIPLPNEGITETATFTEILNPEKFNNDFKISSKNINLWYSKYDTIETLFNLYVNVLNIFSACPDNDSHHEIKLFTNCNSGINPFNVELDENTFYEVKAFMKNSFEFTFSECCESHHIYHIPYNLISINLPSSALNTDSETTLSEKTLAEIIKHSKFSFIQNQNYLSLDQLSINAKDKQTISENVFKSFLNKRFWKRIETSFVPIRKKSIFYHFTSEISKILILKLIHAKYKTYKMIYDDDITIKYYVENQRKINKNYKCIIISNDQDHLFHLSHIPNCLLCPFYINRESNLYGLNHSLMCFTETFWKQTCFSKLTHDELIFVSCLTENDATSGLFGKNGLKVLNISSSEMDELSNKNDNNLLSNERLIHEQLGKLMYEFCIDFFNHEPFSTRYYEKYTKQINYYNNYDEATNYLRSKINNYYIDFTCGIFNIYDFNKLFRIKLFIRELNRMKANININIPIYNDSFNESIHNLREFSNNNVNILGNNLSFSIIQNRNNIDNKFFIDDEEEFELNEDKGPDYLRINKRGFVIKIPSNMKYNKQQIINYVKSIFNSMEENELKFVTRKPIDYINDLVHDGYIVKLL